VSACCERGGGGVHAARTIGASVWGGTCAGAGRGWRLRGPSTRPL
jgi:hypothetical protein